MMIAQKEILLAQKRHELLEFSDGWVLCSIDDIVHIYGYRNRARPFETTRMTTRDTTRE